MSSKIGMLCVSLGIMDIYIYIYECKRCKKVKLNNSFHMLSWVSLQDLPIFSDNDPAERVETWLGGGSHSLRNSWLAKIGKVWQCGSGMLRKPQNISWNSFEPTLWFLWSETFWSFLIFFQILGSFSRFQLYTFSRFNRGNSRAKGWSIRYMWQWHSAGRCRKRLANSESDLWYVWVLRLIN